MNQSLYIPGAVLLGLGVVLLVVWIIYYFKGSRKWLKYTLFISAVVLIIPGAVLLGVGLDGNTVTVFYKYIAPGKSVLYYTPGNSIKSLNINGFMDTIVNNLFVPPVVGMPKENLSESDTSLIREAYPHIDISGYYKQTKPVVLYYTNTAGVQPLTGFITTYYTQDEVAQKQMMGFSYSSVEGVWITESVVTASGNNVVISQIIV